MVGCSVLGCKSRSERNISGITFHKFPSDVDVKLKWVVATGRKKWKPTKYTKMCSLHFNGDAFDFINQRVQIKKSSVPVRHIHAKGGSCCAVASCINYSGKVKNLGRDTSFHRFPKDLVCKKKWILKCRRKDDWNPNSSFICSEHFTAEDYVRDLKAELLEYTPKVRYLKPDAIPSLNLPVDHTQTDEVSMSTLNHRNRMESRLKIQTWDKSLRTHILLIT